jgi:hypothetical protein
MFTGPIYDNCHLFFTPNISGVKTKAIDTSRYRSKGKSMIEMDVGDQWDMDLLFDGLNCLSGSHIRNSDADNFASRILKPMDELDRGRNIMCECIGHRLHSNWGLVADFD